jgi:hypothetical protein
MEAPEVRRLAGLATAGLILAGCASAAPEELCFSSDWATSTHFLHLRADGTFREIRREHMFSREGATGTWRRISAFELEFACKDWVPDVVHGPVRILCGHDWQARLPEVRAGIAGLLVRDGAKAGFPKEDLEQIGEREVELESGDLKTRAVSRPVESSRDEVSRADLERLLDAIDRYDAPRAVEARIVKHRGIVFLHWPHGGPPFAKPWLDEITREIDGYQGKYPPMFVYSRITREAFEKETRATEPFRFANPGRKE